MTDEDTLLAHLANRIAGGAENAAVEALAYILGRSESAAAAFNALVSDTVGGPMEACTAFRTQVTAEDNSRPDLVGYDTARQKRVIIEAKFSAPLRPGQASDYLKQLSLSGPSMLMFVVPEVRADRLWTQIKQDATDMGSWEDQDMGTALHGTKCARSSENDKCLSIVSWRSLLNLLFERSGGEPLVQENIRQLQGLANRMDSEEVLPFSTNELSPNFPRRIMHLHRLVDEALDRGWDDGWISPNGASWRRGTDNYGAGWYLRFTDSDQLAWFGIFYQLWARGDCEDTPLWVQLRDCSSAALNAVERASSVQATDDMNIPILLTAGALYEDILDDVISQLERISEALKNVPSEE